MSSGEFYGEQQPWPPPRRPATPPPAGPSVAAMILSLLVLFGLVAGGAYLIHRWRANPENRELYGQLRPVDQGNGLYLDEEHNIKIYKQSKPSVVHITSVKAARVGFLNVQEVPEGTGSGIVWDDGGHIVTNYHVIRNADAAKVTVFDEKKPTTYNASLVGAYPDKDVAVLRIDAPKDRLHPIKIGTSENLQVGQYTYAIGNPFGLDETMTTGIISALGREIESVAHTPIKNVIQTDAAINPGNSGGALLDSSGRLIGINTAIYSPSGTSSGIGFAIPVDEVNRVAAQLIRSGRITRPSLGIELFPDTQVREAGLKGLLIKTVRPGSPAAKAGLRGTTVENGDLKLGDLIVAFDGQPVEKANDLHAILENHKPGDTVTLTIERDSEQRDVPVTLGEPLNG